MEIGVTEVNLATIGVPEAQESSIQAVVTEQNGSAVVNKSQEKIVPVEITTETTGAAVTTENDVKINPIELTSRIATAVPRSIIDASGAVRPDPNRKLRSYQERGVAWLLDCREKERGCILADEMGLGKTAQICLYIWRMCQRRNTDRPVLIVAPLSTIGHWERELKAWTPLEVCMYHDGGRDARDLRRHYEWWPMVNGLPCPDANRTQTKFHILVTTYDEVIRDADQLETISWAACVVDEAHRLKNEKGRLIESLGAVLTLGTKQRPYQHRVLLTGTPLQNDTKELWTLMNFIEHDEGIFARGEAREAYDENFGKMETAEQVHLLQQAISPHLLRRVKEDVAQDIPVKRETIIDVELTFAQKRYYRALYERNISALAVLKRTNTESNDGTNPEGTSTLAATAALSTSSSTASLGSAMPTMNNLSMELRKCCNHPLLLRGVRESELEKLQDELIQERDNGIIEGTVLKREVGSRLIVPQAGKMVLLDKLLPKLHGEGHKVLIFSQMVKMLSILAEYCQYRSYSYEVLDGRVRGDERQKSIDRFNDPNANSFLMLLSTRAGGVGINLVAADTVIIYDSDWNPQNDIQAMARCHRLGQTKDVMVYRLVARRTFEGQMFDRASRKLGLERAVLAGDLFSSQGGLGSASSGGSGILGLKKPTGPTAAELENLLRRGAYGLIEAENDADTRAQAFCEADIDEILKERATVRVMEGEETASWLNKSSFAVDDNRSDLNVNDPRFWEKAMPDMKTPELLITRLDRGFFKIKAQRMDTSQNKSATKKPPTPKKIGNTEAPNTATSAMDETIEEVQLIGEIPKDDDVDEDEKQESDLEIDEDIKESFWTDLETLIKNAIKHRQKGVLSERERQSTMRLLLRISCDSRMFDQRERSKANSWYKKLEGTRRRGNSQQQVRDSIDDDDDDDDEKPRRKGRRNRDDDYSFEEDNIDDEGFDHLFDENASTRRRGGPRALKGGREKKKGGDRRRPPLPPPTENEQRRKNLPRRKKRGKGFASLNSADEDMEFLDMDDDDPRNLSWRIEYNGRTRKEKAIVGPPLPEAPSPDMTVDKIGTIMKYGQEHFYVSCNNDTINDICDLIDSEKIYAPDLVKLNRRRFPLLSRAARLMPRTCIMLPSNFDESDANEFNMSISVPPTKSTSKKKRQFDSNESRSGELRIIIKNPKYALMNGNAHHEKSTTNKRVLRKKKIAISSSDDDEISVDISEADDDDKEDHQEYVRPRRSVKRVKYVA
uniref:Uncharacterized protein n=1 Tax=Aureoumbra lagunensis TaxID=44058 RepID=A0A7S3JXU5_9STRA